MVKAPPHECQRAACIQARAELKYQRLDKIEAMELIRSLRDMLAQEKGRVIEACDVAVAAQTKLARDVAVAAQTKLARIERRRPKVGVWKCPKRRGHCTRSDCYRQQKCQGKK